MPVNTYGLNSNGQIINFGALLMNANENIVIAVLPFENLSMQRELDIFCRSFSEDLVTELSKFKQFSVIGPSVFSSFHESGSLVEKTNTDYYIQGSFRYDKDPVRINVQLYDNVMRHLVWGNRLQGNLTGLSDLQENLLTQVVGALQKQINYDLISKIKKRPKVDFRAYEHWLHGMEEVRKGTVESDIGARKHFETAIAIQPDYSLAYSGMSLTYFNEWSCQLWQRWDVCRNGAYEWAQKAIELDDQNYIAAMVLGKVLLFEGSYETAEYYLRKSLQLNSNDPDTLILIAAYFVYLGYRNEALDLYERVKKLNPVADDSILSIGSFIYFELGEFEKASKLIVNTPGSKWADIEAHYAAIYYHLNREDKMKEHWDKFLGVYQELINDDKDIKTGEVIKWLYEMNPHKRNSQIGGFLEFIGKGEYRQTVPSEFLLKQDKFDNQFMNEGATWKLSFENSTVQLPEVKGFHDLHRLIARPNQLIHCAQLMDSVLDQKGEKLFDDKARLSYEKKLLDLQRSIQDAEAETNFVMLEKLQNEYDQLIEHLGKSLGLRGKIRETARPVEKARSAVTWRIRKAIAKIEMAHPLLGAHLSNSVKTGIFCCYQPERDLTWILS